MKRVISSYEPVNSMPWRFTVRRTALMVIRTYERMVGFTPCNDPECAGAGEITLGVRVYEGGGATARAEGAWRGPVRRGGR